MMLTKILVCVSKHLRGLTFLSRTNVIHRFCQSASVTDKVELFSTKYFEDNKVNNEFKSSTIPPKILHFLERDKKTINGSDILDVMTSLLNQYKQQKLVKNVHEQVFFKTICAIIYTHMNELQMHEVIEILKILNKIEVPSSSDIIITLFHHIDTLLSTLSLEDFINLSKIIIKMKPSSTTETMMRKLNSKFIIKFSTDFDINDLEFLSKALRYTCFNLKDKRILEIIIEALSNNNFKTATVSCAVSLIISLSCMSNYPSGWYTVLNRAQDILINNIQQMTNNEIINTLHKIADAVKDKRMKEFYNESLFNKCAQRLISEDVGLTYSINCLQSFNEVRHVDKNLLNYIYAKYYEEKQMAESYLPYQIEKLFTLVSASAYLKYKPIFWDEIYESLKTKRLLTYNYETLVIYSLHLACLDCYDQAVLDKIFKTPYDFPKPALLAWTFLKLWQKLNIIPNFDAPSLSQKHIQLFKGLHVKTNKSILSSLEEGMGGSMYVKKNLKTKLYHHIDFVVAFQSRGYPIAINDIENSNTENTDTDIEYLENLRIPSNCQTITILWAPHTWYSRNTGQLLGPYSVYVETLEALSYRVILINEEIWNELQDNSRIPFIMKNIECKLN